MSWKDRFWAGVMSTASGFSLGLASMLLLSRWTWLEMRWNTGQSWWVATLIFLIIGLLFGKRFHYLWLVILDSVLLISAILTGSNGAIKVLPAALFREGLAWSALPLEFANFLIITFLVGSHLLLLRGSVEE